MKMKQILMSAAVVLSIIGCSKDEEITETKSATELLTQKEWIITGAGFDDNKNGVLDQHENTLQDCQEDNTYIFRATGNGSVADNALSCGNPVNNDFQWSFGDNETKLKIGTENNFIWRLDEEEMVLSPDLRWLNVSFIMMYRHG